MINYKTAKYKELLGDYNVQISAVEVAENNYFNPGEDNSTEYILNIDFIVEDRETLEPIEFTQKYISPLSGGRNLFQQLLDVRGEIAEVDGGQFEEQDFVGMGMIATFVKNKKGYSNIQTVKPLPEKKAKPVASKVAAKAKPVKEEDALPFD